MVIPQKDPWLLERVQGLFGGNIGRRRSVLDGKTFYGYAWHIHGLRARGLLMTIYPLLSPWRQRQVKIALLRTAHTPPASLRAGFCYRGHELTATKSYADSKGRRSCRECRRIRERASFSPRFTNRRSTFDPDSVPLPEGSHLLLSPTSPLKTPITVLEIAWAAGVYEGEGSCQPNATGKHHRIGASVRQKDQWILERLRVRFGGGIGKRTSRLKGKTHTTAAWYITGPRARAFLMTIYAFLSPRRKQEIRVALSRTSRRTATPEFCRRGHAVKESAAYHRAGGRYCRTCKNDRERQRYQNDAAYRQRFLQRLAERRADRLADGSVDLSTPKRPRLEACRRGHPFTTENTIVNPRRGRQCRTCWNDWRRQWERRRRAQERSGNADEVA